MKETRHYTLLDKICLHVDQFVRALGNQTTTLERANPAADIAEEHLPANVRRKAAALMRINHAGEICAQALYNGQSFASRNKDLTKHLQQAALEEGDHLAWCAYRLKELNSHTSYLNPLWYAGSFAIGAFAGLLGDAWSLGFIAETEQQVVKHLQSHAQQLKTLDAKSYHIVLQMQQDESQHREAAILAGGRELPQLIKQSMALTAKVMVKTAYWV